MDPAAVPAVQVPCPSTTSLWNPPVKEEYEEVYEEVDEEVVDEVAVGDESKNSIPERVVEEAVEEVEVEELVDARYAAQSESSLHV